MRVEVGCIGGVGFDATYAFRVPLALAEKEERLWLCKSESGRILVGSSHRTFGDANGPAHREIALRGEFPTGIEWAEITPLDMPAPPFAAHPLVSDKPKDLLPSISYQGNEVVWDVAEAKTHTSACLQTFELLGSTRSGPKLNARMELRVPYMQPHFDYALGVTYSDVENPLAKIDASQIKIEWREHAEIFESTVEGFPALAASMLTQRGRVLASKAGKLGVQWDPNVGRPFVRLDAAEWAGHVLGHPGLQGSRDWLMSRDWMEGGPAIRMRDYAGATGDTAAFGMLSGIEAFFVRAESTFELLRGVSEEATRQIHHYVGGKPYRWDPKGKVSTFNSLPDPRFGTDMLSFGYAGKEGQSAYPEIGQLSPQDEAHLDHDMTMVAEIVHNDPIARWVREAQVEALLPGQRYYVNHTRAVGRPLSFMADAYCLADADRRDAIEHYVTDRVANVMTKSREQMPKDAEVFPLMIDTGGGDYGPLGGWASGWAPGVQVALLLQGMIRCRQVMPDVLARAMEWSDVLRACRTVCLYGFHQPATAISPPIPAYVVEWKADGSVGATVPAGSVGAFLRQVAPLARVLMDEGAYDDATKVACDDILRWCPVSDWDTARWLGGFAA